MPTLHFTIFMNCFFSVSNINLLSVQSVRLGCFSCLIARGGLLRFWCFNNIYINSSHTVYRAEKWKNYSDSMSVLRRIYDTTKSYFETRGKIFENFFPSEFLKLLKTLWIYTTLIGINIDLWGGLDWQKILNSVMIYWRLYSCHSVYFSNKRIDSFEYNTSS